jgi:hypothetical protein
VTPAIEAAWIAAGAAGFGVVSTATVAVVGFRSTRNATVRTITASTANTMASLAAAREDRLWEKRAGAYEETLAALQYRQVKRQHELRMYRLDEDSEQQLKDFFASYEPPGWFQAQARLRAYASDEVWEAFEATRLADQEVWGLYQHWQMLADSNRLAVESGHPGAAADGETMIRARRAVNPAVAEAEARDEAIIKLIREELRNKPESTSTALEHSVPRRRRRGHSSE